MDYSDSLVDAAKRVVYDPVELYCAEAIEINESIKYDSVFSYSAFEYFYDYDYAETVMKRMVEKSNHSIGILDIHDIDLTDEFESYRRSIIPDYDTKYTYHKLYHSGGVKEPKYLLGTSYAPLRSEFQGLPDRFVKERATDVLISTGGADFEHMTLGLLDAVLSMSSSDNGEAGEAGGDLTFHFIIGSMNEDREEIHSLATNQSSIVLHFNVQNMSSLMREMDLAISAAGSTLYELCATQTPTIIYILADNQIPGARGFEEHGVLTCAGDVRESSASELSKKLIEEAVRLAGDYRRRVKIGRRMKEVVDGGGTERIIKAVFGRKD